MRDRKKAVLISIQPKWCELIASGKKPVEVRKNKPKLETPFKCYIYCTKGRGDCLWRWNGIWYDTQFPNERPNRLDGKVIGEFVCDCITPLYNVCYDEWERLLGGLHRIEKELVGRACLTEKELHDYANGKRCYAWHITDLVIYDKPKYLCEFFQVKEIRGYHKKDEPKTEGINVRKLLNSGRFEVKWLTRQNDNG